MANNDFSKHLIVIDMQNDFLTGALANPDAVAILPNVIAKVKAAREAGDVRITWTKDTHHENYMDTQEGQKLPVPHCIADTWGHELADGLEVLESEGEFWKGAFGSWGMVEDIKKALEQHWMDWHIIHGDRCPDAKGRNVEIELIGVCTDICVISNAMLLKAALPEAKIIVDASCCAGVTPESHKTALEAMKACQIEVVGENAFIGSESFTFDFPEEVDENGESFATRMAPCLNCRTNENLHIRSDLVSLNALEYWVDCDGCGESWTDRMMGLDYAETPEILVDQWNEKMGIKPEMTD